MKLVVTFAAVGLIFALSLVASAQEAKIAEDVPAVMPNYGWYVANQIPCGALVGRIGEKGQVMKLGRSLTFVAKNAGVLQLAIGMSDGQAGEGNQFPGEYKVNIRVEPK